MATTVFTVAQIAATAYSAYSASKAADEQSEAIEKAAESTEEWQIYLQKFEEKKYDEAERFRNLAYKEGNLQYQQAQKLLPMYTEETMATYPSTMDLLRKDVLRPPGTSELFKQGVGNIAAGLAPYGVSPKGSAFGRMYSNLLAQDIESTRQGRFQLAGYGTQPSMQSISPETGYPDFSGATSAQSDLANLMGMQGATQAGLYSAQSKYASQLPAYFNLLQNQWGNLGGGTTFSSNVPAQGTPVTSGGGYLTY